MSIDLALPFTEQKISYSKNKSNAVAKMDGSFGRKDKDVVKPSEKKPEGMAFQSGKA
jgi:hypothetical protein